MIGVNIDFETCGQVSLLNTHQTRDKMDHSCIYLHATRLFQPCLSATNWCHRCGRKAKLCSTPKIYEVYYNAV